jgi:hypothetical protein
VQNGGTIEGNYHKVENFYYVGRDGRRAVRPPPVIFDQTKTLLADGTAATKLKPE